MKSPLFRLLLAVGLFSTLRAEDPAPAAAPTRIQPRGPSQSVLPSRVTDWPRRIAAQDPGSQGEAWAQAELDDSGWETMTLPTHWEKAGLPDYDGVVWFRRSIEIPAEMAAGEAVLSLGAIDDMDVTWVNGQRVGGHERAGAHFTPRNYKLPKGLLVAGENHIAVRVMDHGSAGGLAQTHGKMQLTAAGAGLSIPLTGAWRYRPGATLAQLLRPAGIEASGSPPPKPFPGKFALLENDVVAFAGGTTMVKQMESGYLEALLTRAAHHPVYFRDTAWQADTVYRQQRPHNFGSHLDLLNRINASVIIANFGQMECLDGATRLPQFLAAYEQLLDQFARRTPRIVLVSPHLFARTNNPHLPDLSVRNGDVAAYAEGIRQLAQQRGYLFVDLTRLDPSGLTLDGFQLTSAGKLAWARQTASQLLGENVSDHASALEGLRQMIGAKNRLWHQHWRPTNWAFLYGDRQHVPSSHDHRPGEPRWFPEEVNAIIPMIEKAEEAIMNLKGGK